MYHVRNSSELAVTFSVPPAGSNTQNQENSLIRSFFFLGPTPIVPVLRRVLQEKQHEIEERKLLILIATDGIPTDSQGHRDIRSFEYVLKNERKPYNRIPITIIACTGEFSKIQWNFFDLKTNRFLDDDDCIGYLNDWDRKIPNLDVVDDYRNEKKEIQARQGKQFPFSFGDVRNILIGNVVILH